VCESVNNLTFVRAILQCWGACIFCFSWNTKLTEFFFFRIQEIMCFISSEFFSPQNIARRSEVSNAYIFVECHFVRFDSNQNSTDFNRTPYFEFHQTFLRGFHTEIIDAMHFRILKKQNMWKKRIILSPEFSPKMDIISTRHSLVEWVTTLAVCFVSLCPSFYVSFYSKVL